LQVVAGESVRGKTLIGRIVSCMTGYIQQQIKRTASNSLGVLAFFILIACIFNFVVALHNNPELLVNPYRVLHKTTDMKVDYIAKVKAEKVYDIGYDVTSDGKTKAKLGLVGMPDGGSILVKLDSKFWNLLDKEQVELSGRMVPINGQEREILIDLLRPEGYDESAALSPEAEAMIQSTGVDPREYDYSEDVLRELQIANLKIDTNQDYGDIIALFVIAAVVALVLLGFAVKQILIMLNYQKSKAYAQLSKLGAASTVEAEINRAVADGDYLPLGKHSVLTKEFVAVFDREAPSIRAAKDLVQAYRRLTKHYTNGIPSGKTHSVILVFNNHQEAKIAMKNQAAADVLLDQIANECPDLMVGYQQKAAPSKAAPPSKKPPKKSAWNYKA
jgi:hypothetical protein